MIKANQSWHAFKELVESWCDDPTIHRVREEAPVLVIQGCYNYVLALSMSGHCFVTVGVIEGFFGTQLV